MIPDSRLQVLAFFVVACLASWVAWLPLAMAVRGLPYLHLVGGLGPLVAAAGLTAWVDGRAGLLRLARRCVPSRASLPWLGIAVAGPFAIFLVGVGVPAVAGEHLDWSGFAQSREYATLGPFSYVVASIVFYGFGEEVGWRGFALPRLQGHVTALRAALIVGAGWAAWHLPLFAFAPGLSSMGIGGMIGWLVSMFTGSILMTWLFNESRGSVLAVALFHGTLDVLMVEPPHAWTAVTMGAALTVVGLVLPRVVGPTDLSRAPRVVDAASEDTAPLTGRAR